MERWVFLVCAVAYAALVIGGYVEILVGWNSIVQWAYAHEDLASGLLALLAALIGASLLQRQISQSDRHERTRLASKRTAVRTVLPLALSSLTAYATASGKAAASLMDQCVNGALPDDPSKLNIPEKPVPPDDSLAALKEMVEFLAPEEVRPFVILVADIQVQAARLASSIDGARTGDGIETRLNFEQYVLDAAFIYARAESLFDFARGRSETVPGHITWDRVRAALFFFGVDTDEEEPIMKTLARRSKGNIESRVPDRWAVAT